MPRYSLSSLRSSATSGSMTAYGVSRRLADVSERSRYCYDDETHYARDTERHYRECERLLGRRSRGSDGGHGEVTDRAQRILENGEALKYIDLMLQRLRRASKDHQELVRQRHTDLQHEISRRIDERIRQQYHYHLRDRREDSIYASRTWSSSSPWESDSILRRSRPDVTTRLLTKRRDYGGTAHSSTVDILRPVISRHVRDGLTAATYQEMKYIPKSRDWEEETFGAWSLPEASSSNDRKTSSTVV